MKNNKSQKSHLAQYYLRKAATKGKKLLVVQVWNHVLSNWLSLIQYRSKVSYHLSSHFSPDGSRFSPDVSRFSWESLKHLVWHMLHVWNRLCVMIVALQFTDKSMGPELPEAEFNKKQSKLRLSTASGCSIFFTHFLHHFGESCPTETSSWLSHNFVFLVVPGFQPQCMLSLDTGKENCTWLNPLQHKGLTSFSLYSKSFNA